MTPDEKIRKLFGGRVQFRPDAAAGQSEVFDRDGRQQMACRLQVVFHREPVDAFAGVSNCTIWPVIVRASESAAVIVNGVNTFIGSSPLEFGFLLHSMRQRD